MAKCVLCARECGGKCIKPMKATVKRESSAPRQIAGYDKKGRVIR